MILDESLFEDETLSEVEEPSKKLYQKRKLSKTQMYDKVIDKLQTEIRKRKYKVGTDGDYLTINKKLFRTRNKEGRPLVTSKFITNEQDFRDIIEYLKLIKVPFDFKKVLNNLILVLKVDLNNAEEVYSNLF